MIGGAFLLLILRLPLRIFFNNLWNCGAVLLLPFWADCSLERIVRFFACVQKDDRACNMVRQRRWARQE